MASPAATFAESLQSASAQPNHARATAYETLVADLLQAPASKVSRADLLEATSAYLRHAVFSEQNATGGGLVVGRQALTALEHHSGRIAAEYEAQKSDKNRMQDVEDENMPAIADSDTRRLVLENALEQLQPRVLSFEEQASSLRMQLASLLEADEDWNEAARVLLAIPLDSGHRNVSDHFKLSIYVRIARLLLEGDDPVAADMYLKRASMIIHNVPGALPSHFQQQQQQEASAQTTSTAGKAPDSSGSAEVGSMDASGNDNDNSSGAAGAKHKLEEPKVLGLQYRLSQARVYDSQRRFAEAAVRYHELSYMGEIDEDDRAMMLSAAVTASILSPAGPQRARTLATLMRDERTPSLPQYTILSKVFLDRVIRADEIADFEKLLSPHQIARLGPSSAPIAVGESRGESVRHAPSTVLDRAMIEHNVLSASRLYDNITLAGLGALVNLSPEGAEEIARKMIMQGRLKGWIDQVGSSTDEASARGRGVLFFMDQERRGEGETTAGGLSATKDAGTSAGDVGSGAGGAGGDEGAGSGGGTSDLDTKWTRRWDQQIASVTGALEDVCQRLNQISAGASGAVASVTA